MDEIDRRALIGIAGAGLAVAACKGEIENKSIDGKSLTNGDKCFDLESYKNDVRSKGIFPSNQSAITIDADGRQRPYKYTGNFNPNFICIVYIKFLPGKVKIKHAHFSMPKVDVPGFVELQLNNVQTHDAWINPYINDKGVSSEGVNFDDWKFGSQHIVYIGLDNGTDVTFDPENLLQFAFFSARRRGGKKVSRHENNSFMNTFIDSGIWNGNQVLVTENWYVNEDGADIPKKDKITPEDVRRYSMNIHMKMRFATNTGDGGYDEVPLVLDPDTGNMGSDP